MPARYFQGLLVVEWDRYGHLIISNEAGRVKLDGDDWAFILAQVRTEWPDEEFQP